ncbi:hypothetical protein EIP91_011956 [Steccherinum ochraceum]|uniref:Uncharacterized protein n=1 Tax=Steccherinum ochraceum TaxID=92696 RepID=A0A4R0RH30_9APHY|nr:hypothetical protein EIP91_011956 [Steccherinum ochraceum]
MRTSTVSLLVLAASVTPILGLPAPAPEPIVDSHVIGPIPSIAGELPQHIIARDVPDAPSGAIAFDPHSVRPVSNNGVWRRSDLFDAMVEKRREGHHGHGFHGRHKREEVAEIEKRHRGRHGHDHKRDELVELIVRSIFPPGTYHPAMDRREPQPMGVVMAPAALTQHVARFGPEGGHGGGFGGPGGPGGFGGPGRMHMPRGFGGGQHGPQGGHGRFGGMPRDLEGLDSLEPYELIPQQVLVACFTPFFTTVPSPLNDLTPIFIMRTTAVALIALMGAVIPVTVVALPIYRDPSYYAGQNPSRFGSDVAAREDSSDSSGAVALTNSPNSPNPQPQVDPWLRGGLA